MSVLRRLATAPAPRTFVTEWRAELLAAALLVGGLVGMAHGV